MSATCHVALRRAVAICLVAFVACGGRSYVDYSDPDADLATAQDGGDLDAPVLGHAGSACTSFDGSIFDNDGPECETWTDCIGWHASYPHGLDAAFVEFADCFTGRCGGTLEYTNDLPSDLRCFDDAYCRAFAQQFVTHGEAMGTCLSLDEGRFCSFRCATSNGDEKHPFCIRVGDTFRYAAPCADESTDLSSP